MFVKIVRNNGSEGTYECEGVRMKPMAGDDNKVLMALESQSGVLDFDLDKTDCGVFIMNNDGKTIDRYIWKE